MTSKGYGVAPVINNFLNGIDCKKGKRKKSSVR